jgi:hypothetical protein
LLFRMSTRKGVDGGTMVPSEFHIESPVWVQSRPARPTAAIASDRESGTVIFNG